MNRRPNAFYSESLGLSGAAFMLLRDLIHERTGLCYDDGKNELLSDKLSERVVDAGFSSFLDYYYYLKYDEAAAAEWLQVMDTLSVPETFFWREMQQVQALVEVVVPRFFAAQVGPLRIWSAACASGEEPLSIAMALNEAGWLRCAPIEIYASDASRAAIAKAQAGLYRERSFRNLPAALRERYFRKEQDGERILPEIHKAVNWSVANLVDEAEIRALAASPVIFCRNVFIYFSGQMVSRVAGTLGRYMPSPSYLFLGAAESLLRASTVFELDEVGGAFVYVKR
jgi:chemotaxis protein methyltransferase CheR